MKRLLTLIVTVLVFSSCTQLQEELDALSERVDLLESSTIPSIDTQISRINNSISSLESVDSELNDYISALQSTASNLQKSIDNVNEKLGEAKAVLQAEIDVTETELLGEISIVSAELIARLEEMKSEMVNELTQINSTIVELQKKDEELSEKISLLTDYVNNQLNSTKNWANATFATLSQYNSIVMEVATIKVNIESITKSISDLEKRLNEKITADIAVAVSGLNEEIRIQVLSVTEAYTTAISSAKQEITMAYTAAIKNAIEASEISMKEWVNEQLAGYYTISEIDAMLSALQTEMDSKLQAQKTYLENLLENLRKEMDSRISANKALVENHTVLISVLQESVASNATNIAENVKAISANSEAISNNATDISKNANAIIVNANTISNNTAAIDALNVKIDSLGFEMNSLVDSLTNALNKSIADLEDRTSNTESDIEGIESEIELTRQKIDEIIVDYSSKIVQLQEEVANLTTLNAEAIASNKIAIANNSVAIEAIDSVIVALEKAVNESIAANSAAISDNSLKINENISAIANNAQKISVNATAIANNASLIASNTSAIADNSTAIAKNSDEIIKLKQSLDDLRTTLVEEYSRAINDAIIALDGKVANDIAEVVTSVNNQVDGKISALEVVVNNVENRIEAVENKVETIQNQIQTILNEIAAMKEQITNLLGRIQSITYIPQYSDGAATMELSGTHNNGVASFDFQISPKDAVEDLVNIWHSSLSMHAVYTQTRSVSFIDLPITSFMANKEQGVISITVSGVNLSDDYYFGEQSASAALSISDGNNCITSNYIQMIPTTARPNATIKYSSSDGNLVFPSNNDAFAGASITLNIMKGGFGYLQFDRDLTDIGSAAFKNCTRLTSITIPAMVTNIGNKNTATNAVAANVPRQNMPTMTNPPTGGGNSSIDLGGGSSTRPDGGLGGDTTVSTVIGAFEGCTALSAIYLKSKTPSESANFGDMADSYIIYVPEIALSDYNSASAYSNYVDYLRGYNF